MYARTLTKFQGLALIIALGLSLGQISIISLQQLIKTTGVLEARLESKPLMLQKSIGEGGLPVINASDYDGENDTERLQAALNDVPKEGAIVFISSGVWVAAGLKAKSNTIILGMNGTVVERPENTTVPFITFENASNFALFNLTFRGKNIPEALGVMIIDCQSFVIQKNAFFNVDRSAVKVIITVNGTSQNFMIADNLFVNCQNVPTHVFGVPSRRAIRNFSILNNTIINGTRNGKIGVAFSANGTIKYNKILNCQHGIATRCVSNLTIAENCIENITDYGIYLGTQIGDRGTDNVEMEGNKVYSGRIGVSRYYGNYPLTSIKITNSIFVNNSEYDILADFPGQFINNTITDASKLKIKDPAAIFIETKTVSGQLILPGDLNYDLKINIIDVALVAISFGSSEGYPNWNEAADIISDGKIDIKDVSYVAENFGLIAKP